MHLSNNNKFLYYNAHCYITSSSDNDVQLATVSFAVVYSNFISGVHLS